MFWQSCVEKNSLNGILEQQMNLIEGETERRTKQM